MTEINDNAISIQDKFFKVIYEITSISPIVYMEPPAVYINRDAPSINEIECLESCNFQEKKFVHKNLRPQHMDSRNFI